MRRYDYQERCCEKCLTLLTPEAFRYHTEVECFWADLKNIKLQKEIEAFKEVKDENCSKRFTPESA